MPMITFDRRKLLPEIAGRKNEAQVFFLMLLHQKEDAYGYAMFHFQPGETPSVFFQPNAIGLNGNISMVFIVLLLCPCFVRDKERGRIPCRSLGEAVGCLIRTTEENAPRGARSPFRPGSFR